MTKALTIIAVCAAMIGWICPAASIELKTMYQENSYPKYVLDESPELPNASGICVDILRALEQKVPELEFTVVSAVPFKRILFDLENGNIDVFCGMTKTPKREKKIIYSIIPIYEVNFVIAVRADDPIKVGSFEDIRKLSPDNLILTNLGTGAASFLKKQDGLRIDDGGHDIPQNIRKLLGKRGRFYFFHDLGIGSTIKKEALTQNLKILPTSFRNFHHYIGFSRKTTPPGIIEKVNTALESLEQAGELEAIFDSYVQID